jgi:hypothetical protein
VKQPVLLHHPKGTFDTVVEGYAMRYCNAPETTDTEVPEYDFSRPASTERTDLTNRLHNSRLIARLLTSVFIWRA